MPTENDVIQVKCPNCGIVARYPIDWIREQAVMECRSCNVLLDYRYDDFQEFLKLPDATSDAVFSLSVSAKNVARKPRARRAVAETTGTMFDSHQIEITCDSCGQMGLQPLRELVANRTARCRLCQHDIDITGGATQELIAREAATYKRIKHPSRL